MEAELNDEVQSIIYDDSPLCKGVAERLASIQTDYGERCASTQTSYTEWCVSTQADYAKPEIIHFKQTDSTNNQAKLYAAKGCGDRTIFVADYQTSGRGRRGRSWVSDSGSGLWMSLLLRPDLKPENASMLTLVAALAVADALENVVSPKTAGFKCSIKWPNDIVAGKKKLCGILTEMGTDGGNIDYVVIGIGINVNLRQIPDSISQTATSLCLETGLEYEREDIIAEFIKAFEKYYKKFLENCSLSGVLEDYNNRLINRNRMVRVLGTGGEPVGEAHGAGKELVGEAHGAGKGLVDKAHGADKEFVGEALGIDELGALLVRMADGHIEKIVSGEVSVRGLYGYV